MKSRVSYIGVLLACFSSLGLADTAEPMNSGYASLSLFMSAEEQQVIEQNQSEDPLPNSLEDTNEVTPVNVTENVASDNLGDSDSSFRYDGIVMKGSQILKVWFDGNSVASLENFEGIRLQVIDSAGRLELVKGERSRTLLPGDFYYPVGTTVSSLLPAEDAATDEAKKSGSTEEDLSESN